MRLGILLDGTAMDRGGAALRTAAAQAEDHGFDLLWLREDDRLVDPFLAATVAAAATSGLRIGVEVAVGGAHPVVVAEQAAVCDLAIGGRLVLGLRPAEGCEADFGDAAELVLRSHRPRPFRHAGPRWPTPAGLEANAFMRDRTVRVTPPPSQPELPTWITGDAAVAARFGLSPVTADVDDGATAWRASDDRLGEQAVRMSRPAVLDVPLDGVRLDHLALVDVLVGARDTWGLDTAVLRQPASIAGADRDAVVSDLAGIVRPRVQQEQIPSGLLEWWDEELVRSSG